MRSVMTLSLHSASISRILEPSPISFFLTRYINTYWEHWNKCGLIWSHLFLLISFWILSSKEPNHLEPGFRNPGRFLGLLWDRYFHHMLFSISWKLIWAHLNNFYFHCFKRILLAGLLLFTPLWTTELLPHAIHDRLFDRQNFFQLTQRLSWV